MHQDVNIFRGDDRYSVISRDDIKFTLQFRPLILFVFRTREEMHANPIHD